MNERIVIDGLGGQGVILAGKVLASAATLAGLHTAFVPSYGAEVRGGTAHCEVIVSEEPILAPLVEEPTVAVLMCAPSFAHLAPTAGPDCTVLVNASLVPNASRDDGPLVAIPADDIAREVGNRNAANMVMLGAFAGVTGCMPVSWLERAVDMALPAHRRDSLASNVTALRRGAELGAAGAR